MTPEQLASLKTELTNDPQVIGYAGKSHDEIARLINRPSRTLDAETLSSGMLVGCIDRVEFAALPAADKQYLNLFVTAGDVPMSNNVRQALRALFPAGSDTRAKINQATRRSGSRAEELGLGRVTESDVADALLRT
jgi:hypothetical protein